MKKTLNLIILFSLLFIFCSHNSSAQVAKQKVVTQSMDTLYMSATLVKKQFVNKGGKISQTYFEYYLVNENIETFVKVNEGNYKSKDLEKYIGKEMMYAVDVKEGYWDTDDTNEMVQSRTGKYFIILKISVN